MAGVEISYLAALGGGIVSFLSPCVLPLVPAYLSFVAGHSLEEMTAEGPQARVNPALILGPAFLFVLGFSAVFVTLGATASAVSRFLLSNLPLLSQIAGAVIVYFGLAFIFPKLKPAFLDREARFHPDARPLGAPGAFIVGLAFAFGWTPCIGPILAAVLAVAASQDSISYGVTLLAVYSLGLGVPFLLAALGVRAFLGFLGRFRRHYRKVEQASGGLLVATGILIFTGALQSLSYMLLDWFPSLAEIG